MESTKIEANAENTRSIQQTHTTAEQKHKPNIEDKRCKSTMIPTIHATMTMPNTRIS